jgi:hypothetical protein
MLQTFAAASIDYYMTVEEAQQFDQRPFRSMLVRDWVRYRAGHGFYLTKEGRKAWQEFHQTDITRHNPMLPLCAYWRDKYDMGGTMKPVKKRARKAKAAAKEQALSA